jgi:serine/threonine-protein kinase
VTEADPFIGRTLAGRFEVLKKLNQGGVGAVYLAMQRPLDRPVALKVLLRKHADDPTAIKRFEKEAASIARLAHANIVTLFDFGSTDDGDLFIAMEFLRGQSLRDLLEAAGWIPWERSLHILQGVTRALVAAHTQRIVHRDLKPENIMLVESNGDLDFAKVLDFGLARSIQGQGTPQITRHDVIPGTPTYMSPERANGISDDPRSDLYALGAVWFELITGEPPFTGETSIKVILRHVHEPPRPPSQVQPGNPIPPFVDELVLQLLEKQPERRPATAAELLARLETLARPAGWHVAGAADLARRGAHDRELATYAVAAADLAATLDDDADLRFTAADVEPLPLTKKKPPSWSPKPEPRPEPVSEQPLLLTRRKGTSLVPAAAAPAAVPAAVVAPAPASTKPTAEPAPAVLPPTFRSLSTRFPTEEFLRLSPDAQEASLDALHDSTANGIPARIDSVAEVAGWLGTAKTTRAVGELCTAFLASRFERALVVDVRAAVPVPLGRAGFAAPADLPGLVATTAGLPALAGRRDAYYGPSISSVDWMRWYGALGGAVPGAMFVAGLQSDGQLAFVFYADHRDVALRTDVKDTVVLLREAAGALSTLG